MSDATKAVFLSYASQDAEAAKRIADALRDAGVEVWFDQSELVGGDAWDAKIRKQIKECALLIPIISANTQSRTEGYFRLEWRLADQRTHLMAKGRAFLLPVVIDGTRDAEAHVPDSFTEVQWTRLPGGETSEKFCARVKKLLGGSDLEAGRPRPAERGEGAASPRKQVGRWWWALPIFGVAMALLLVLKEKHPDTPEKSVAAPVVPALSPARQLAGRALQFRSLNGLTRERLGAAEDLLEQALKLDPSEPEVWAVGAQVDVLMVFRGWDNSDARRQSAAKRVSRALALAADGFEPRHAQAVLAAFLVQTKESYTEAETIYQVLLQEQPGNRDLLEELGTLLEQVGRYDEAVEAFQRAGQPVLAGFAYYYAKRFEEARRIADTLLAEKRTAEALILKANVELFGFNDRAAAQAAVNQLTPTELREDDAAAIALRLAVLSSDAPGILKLLDTYPRPFVSIGVDYPRQYWTGIARMLQQQPEAAAIEWRGALQSVAERAKAKPDDTNALGWASILQARLGDKAAAERALRLYGNYEDLSKGQWDWVYGLTGFCLGGRNDEVLDRLEKTLRDPDVRFSHILLYTWARFSPEFDPLRGNPRFEKLLRDTLPKGAKPFNDPKPAAEVTKPDDKSVAVLAFANLSDDKDNEYFSDGISEELLNVLAKVPGLKVTARTSSFHFKGKDTAIPEIAQQLGVAYVVEGSVRKQGDKVRITAQLIKAADGFHVWSDTFTRELKDIFAVQDEIAGLIATNLSLKLGTSAGAARAAIDPQAFELYVQARQAWNLRNDAGFTRAEQLLGRALELAPDFARAHVALADVWSSQAETKGITGTFTRPDPPEYARILQKIHQALALDPESAEAHASLGHVLFRSWKFAEAEREFRRAIELNPNYASAHQWGAALVGFDGRMDEALAEMKLASELDPLSSRIADNHAFALYLAGRYTAALAENNRAIALQPSNLQAVGQRAYILAKMGRGPEAIAAVRQLPADFIGAAVYRLVVYAQAGMRTEAEALLPATKNNTYWTDDYLLLLLGRKEEAIAALNLDTCDTPGVFLDPIYDTIDNDPRFKKFIATIGWTQAHERMKAWRAIHPPEKPAAR